MTKARKSVREVKVLVVLVITIIMMMKYLPAYGGEVADGSGNDDGDEILTGIERKVGDTHEDGDGTDDKGQEVSEGGDGDADSSAGQSLAQDLRHVLDRLLLVIAREVLTPRGHQQEHVVHADP